MKNNLVGLYPSIRPYNSGYLSVGDGHRLYYEECGNPKGLPILYVHGGPGSGCSKNSRRFFDRKKWRVILFDQRGCGRSKPYTSISENTTQHLVEDIRKLLKKLGVSEVVLFGGSWGSTLSLVYAIAYPETVSGMVLRGIWLAEFDDIRYYIGGGIASFFPEVWDRFIVRVPLARRKDPAQYYYEQMLSPDPEVRRYYAYEWCRYESAILYLRPKKDNVLAKQVAKGSFEAWGLMEAHYIANKCFFEDGYIMKNISQIAHIPVSLMHGRYDMICPFIKAHRLHKALPHSEFQVIVGGHSSFESGRIRRQLVAATNKMFLRVIGRSS